MTKALIFLSPLLFCWATAALLMAQSLTTGEVNGTVTDPSGAVVSHTSVALKSLDTGSTQTIKTNGSGFYRFSLLKPGSYSVWTSASDFQETGQKVTVQVGQSTTVNMKLALSQSSETVEVTAEVPILQIENGNVSTTFSGLQLSAVPNPGNDLTYLVQTAPGAVMNTGAGYGNFSTFGLPATSNLFTYNGMNANDPFLNLNYAGATNLMLGANDVREVTVVNNGYTGEYGGLAGANVNFVSKSGTNNFHGNAQYFWDGRIMNANDYFNNMNGVSRPFVNANQWAGSFGGPIKKDKTFFFIDQEGLYLTIPTSIDARYPSKEFLDAVQTNLANASQEVQRFYQGIRNLYEGAWGYHSAANTLANGGCSHDFLTGVDPTLGFGATKPCVLDYRATPSNKTHEWIISTRFDQNIGNNDRAFLRFRTDHGVQATYTDPISPLFNLVSNQPQYEGQLNETHIFGPNTVNQFILSGSWYSQLYSEPDMAAARNLIPFTVEFSGTAFYPLGRDLAISPQGRNVTQYGIVDDFSHNIGNHALKFGVSFTRNDITDYDPGYLSNGDVNGETMLDFYNGIASNYQQSFPQHATAPIAMYTLGLYGQDEWRVNSRLKLTFSLRADHNSNPVCQTNCFGRLSNSFDAMSHDASQPYNAALFFNQHQALSSFDAINFQPRFGFAWSPFSNSSTVLRGGFGIFVDRYPSVIADYLLSNPPFSTQFNLSNLPLAPAADGSAVLTAAAANAAFQSAFLNGGTLASIQSSNPSFAAPSAYNPDRSLHSPQYQEWNLEFEQALGRTMALHLNYVGNHGIHEAYFDRGVNAFDYPSGFGGLPTAAPDSRFGYVYEAKSNAVSNYNGLTVSLQRRMSRGLQFQFNYTWSHALDEISNGGQLPFVYNTNTSPLTPQDGRNLKLYNYGNADYDVRHSISLNYVWEMPFKFSKGYLNRIAGGWTVAGTLFFRTGLPYTVWDSAATSDLAGENYGNNAVFAQQLAGGGTCGGSAVVTACPAQVNGYAAVTDLNGILLPLSSFVGRRNQMYGPHYFNTDLTLMKNFKLPRWESGQLAFGAQFFNLLNHPNFDQPIADITDPATGTIIYTASGATSLFGSALGANASPRAIQLRATLTF